MLTGSSFKDGASSAAFAELARRPRIDSRLRPELAKWDALPRAFGEADVDHPVVQISPPDLVKRRAMSWHGVTAESVQWTSRDKVEFRFSAPVHLLVAYEKGERWSGETFIQGVPASSLRSFARRLTLIPAGHGYHEWHEPRAHTRLMYFYVNPAQLGICSDAGITDISFSPRLYFEESSLWHTILKLMNLVERPASGDRRYFEALGVVLMHELIRLNRGLAPIQFPSRGGLAMWQQRIATAYIEEHLTERISLATLAQLVRLSPHYFCRAFKKSLGTPPRRYQANRRIERAKQLLASPRLSITEIGLTLGFYDASSFTAAFRKVTGFTPSAYHRNIT